MICRSLAICSLTSTAAIFATPAEQSLFYRKLLLDIIGFYYRLVGLVYLRLLDFLESLPPELGSALMPGSGFILSLCSRKGFSSITKIVSILNTTLTPVVCASSLCLLELYGSVKNEPLSFYYFCK